jgi:hypothetical protein
LHQEHTAVTGIFKSVSIGALQFVGGGALDANNPADEEEGKAAKI